MMMEQAKSIGIEPFFRLHLSDRIIMLCPSETALKVACTHFSKARSSPFILFNII
jgi:hypothetical protein